jgi:hypothetical protein
MSRFVLPVLGVVAGAAVIVGVLFGLWYLAVDAFEEAHPKGFKDPPIERTR